MDGCHGNRRAVVLSALPCVPWSPEFKEPRQFIYVNGKKNVQPTPPVAHVREGPEPVYKLSFVSLPLYSLGMYASWNKVIYLDLG